MWPHWIVLQHAAITDVRRPILHYLPNTPSNSSCPHYGGAPNYHQGPWSHKLQEFSRIQNSLSGCSDLVYLQIREINFALFTFSLYRDIKTYTLFIGEKWSQTCDWGWTVSRVPTLVWYCICKIITWLTGRVVLFWRWTVREWKEGGDLATTPWSRIELWTWLLSSPTILQTTCFNRAFPVLESLILLFFKHLFFLKNTKDNLVSKSR